MILYTPLAILVGFILDLIFGDPYNLPHPIRLIGNLISGTEKLLRKILNKNPGNLLFGGFVLVIAVVTLATAVPIVILTLLYHFIPIVGFLVESIMCYYILAMKCLKTESMKVYRALEKEDVEGARYAVSMIVGRDTKTLDKEGITKATVETVAENASDGEIAPLFYLAIGGPILGFFYKAVNTMDSMVGYKNEKYYYFGRYAAKLDDVLNFIPSRLGAIFMIIMAPLLKLDGKGARKIFKRDRKNHKSPNSAQTEAACAGALGIRLGGDAYYFGELHHKPTIGDDTRPIENRDIKRANDLMYGASIFALTVFLGVRVLIGALISNF
jgi:adenosylcobinamide-phosphate synthase